MKPKQSTFLLRPKLLLLAVLILFYSTKIFAINGDREIAHSHKAPEDKKPAKKEKAFKNSNAIKIFPDLIKKAMHVVAKGNNEREINFFVFDLEGRMVINYKMKTGDRKIISGLQRGAYIYHVFCEDEQIATGKIQFR